MSHKLSRGKLKKERKKVCPYSLLLNSLQNRASQRGWRGGGGRGEGVGYVFPCSQQNFPCVPLFPNSTFFSVGGHCFLKK